MSSFTWRIVSFVYLTWLMIVIAMARVLSCNQFPTQIETAAPWKHSNAVNIRVMLQFHSITMYGYLYFVEFKLIKIWRE